MTDLLIGKMVLDFWPTFWTVAFALTILVYTGLVLIVAFGGWKDVKAMFRDLDEQHRKMDEKD